MSMLDNINEEIKKLQDELNNYPLNMHNRESVNWYNIINTKINIKKAEYNKYMSENCSCDIK